jgi:PIN domain nuclease of toxin-antitoxin system
LSAEEWLDRFLDRPGIPAVPLDPPHRAACRAYRLDRLEHRDPTGRLLIATAIELACPLFTYDERIAQSSIVTPIGRRPPSASNRATRFHVGCRSPARLSS